MYMQINGTHSSRGPSCFHLCLLKPLVFSMENSLSYVIFYWFYCTSVNSFYVSGKD